MKLIFEANEQEKREILEQHNLFKKVLQSKVTRLMVNEQSTPLTGVEFLKAARDKKCKIAVGGVIKSAPGKPSVLYKLADYDSANGYFKKGDELYIKDDYTFDVVTTDATGAKTKSAQGKKWACPAMTADAEAASKLNVDKTKQEGEFKTKEELLKVDTEQNIENPVMYEKKVVNGVTLYRRKISGGIGAALTEDQQKIVDKWKSQGAKLRKELDPEEAKTWVSRVVSPASEGYFSQDLIMYFDPTVTVKDATITTTIQTAVTNRIPTDQKDCKTTIEAYYLAFKKKRPLEPNEFEALKAKTQACKNEYGGDWSALSGGRRMDNYLEIMSGGVGGPSRRGEDAKWRLN
jgi:hypothetical protein